ncbi:uncharacterized protein LOC133903087 [Phragmites australis]|uniref:uncharacterized protein LOC133903087 n=1 Tax=Phragmites australis TaxID=29695 RepID=UPI002D78EB86|nr:uncharacterized protein LOC133903087 [Phragmites australis]
MAGAEAGFGMGSVRRSRRLSRASGEDSGGSCWTDRGGGGRREAGQDSPIPFPSLEVPVVLYSCMSPRTVHDELQGLDEEKIGLLREVGLGGLMSLPSIKVVDRGLSLWLLRRLRPKDMKLQLGDNSFAAIREQDINRVLGIVSGRELVSNVHSSLVEHKVKRLLGVHVLNISSVRGVLENLRNKSGLNSEEKNAFRVAAVLVSFGYMLWANNRGGATICKELLIACSIPEKLRMTNWAEFILRTLSSSATKIQADLRAGAGSVLLGGCLIFLQILYLDCLEFGVYSVPANTLPRIAGYTAEKLRELIRMDKSNQGGGAAATFGQIKRRRDAVTRSQGKEKNVPDACRGEGEGGGPADSAKMMNMADRAEVMALLEQRDNSLLRNLATQLDVRRRELVKEIFGQTCSTGANKVGSEQNVSSSVAPTRCGAKLDIGISGDKDAAGMYVSVVGNW